eukprot:scaffold8264_cov109-Isochrysis_galbana.AAC.6
MDGEDGKWRVDGWQCVQAHAYACVRAGGGGGGSGRLSSNACARGGVAVAARRCCWAVWLY